jgi:nicotinate-nucleotide pyrophosphorylase (carboxylating)
MTLEMIIEQALAEDIGLGDLTTEATVAESARARAEFLCKAGGVIAGLEVAAEVFRLCDDETECAFSVADGERVVPGVVIARVTGHTRSLLRGERTALNFLQRMSGIATATAAFVDAVAGTRAKITDTRKTVPGLRMLDKRAVALGGGVNHRFGLDDMVLIKDNHIIAAGGLRAAVDRVRSFMEERHVAVPVEVETTSLREVEEALSCTGISRIMLDNFPLGEMRDAVQRVGGRVEVEASGNVTLATVRAIADTGVDFISVGALTHSVRALDISLELLPSV